MTDGLRAAVAYIAARLASGEDASAIFDYSAGSYVQFSGEVSAARVNIYDYGRSCFLDGTPPSLYDHGGSNAFDFKATGATFEGYDYGSSTFFEGTVDGGNVNVYDFGKSAYFDYSL